MTWNDIGIEKGRELSKLYEDDYYKDNPEEKLIQQLCIIFDMDYESVCDLPLSVGIPMRDKCDFLNTTPNVGIDKVITIDGCEYHLIDLDTTKISVGEFIDLDYYVKSPLDNLENIMALLYRPKGEKYDSSLVPERALTFKDKFPYGLAHSVGLFFYLLAIDFIKTTTEYSLLDQMMMNLEKMKLKIKEQEGQLVPQRQKKKKRQKKNSNGTT